MSSVPSSELFKMLSINHPVAFCANIRAIEFLSSDPYEFPQVRITLKCGFSVKKLKFWRFIADFPACV